MGRDPRKNREYCAKLKNVVFDFVCHENTGVEVFLYNTKRADLTIEATGERLMITELKFKRAKTTTNLYDYHMVRKGEEGFEPKCSIYGPAGLLSPYWQDFFDDKIIGMDAVEGRVAILIDIDYDNCNSFTVETELRIS